MDKKMDDLIRWYIKDCNFTNEEKLSLRIAREASPEEASPEEYKELIQQYFDRMPFCNLTSDDHFIAFDESGTAFIDKIFEREVDDDTLVISTTYEHTSVQKCLAVVKNKILLNSDRDIRAYNISPLIEEAKKYKKVFVYIIGTQLSTGEITPQLFYEKLKEAFVSNNIEHKIMIDDVHGMFMTPRDYRIFDYVLYTAHSLVTEYNMGLLITKEYMFGKRAYNWGKEYLEKLDIILKRRLKMLQFKNIIIQYLNEYLSDTNMFRLFNFTSDHIFAVETVGLEYDTNTWEKLDLYKIRVSEFKMVKNWIRIRFQEFTRLSEDKAIEGLHYLCKIIEKAKLIQKMRG